MLTYVPAILAVVVFFAALLFKSRTRSDAR
jgi:hypothetical protein